MMTEQNGIDILCDAASSDLLLSPILPTSSRAGGGQEPFEKPEQGLRSSKRLRRPEASTPSVSSHTCHICKRVYERADHLTRHLRSHENARPYQCTRCPKRFNRADLLTRHESTHDRDDGRSRPSIRRGDRANQACEACVIAKAKCDDQKPCGRCRFKQLVCQNPRRGSPFRSYTEDLTFRQGDSFPDTATTTSTSTIGGNNLPASHLHVSLSDSMEPAAFVAEPVGSDIILGEPISDETAYFNPMHNLFQDIDFQMPWDLNFDAFSIPQLEVQGPSPQSTNTTNTKTSSRAVPRNPSRGHAAFKRSPWLWEPKQGDYVHQEKEGLHIDEQSIAQSPVFGRLMERPSRNLKFSSHQRDRIFSVVLAQNKDSTKVPTFPTLDLLNYLLQAHFVQDGYQLDSWIHAASFDPDTAMPEVVASFISSGATYISVPAIWQFGLAMQEVVRLGMSNVFERSNANTRDLQALQGYMLNLDVGMWSGFKRKMEIAESFCQPLLTMLRRAGTFSSPPDSPSVIPLDSDSAEVLQEKWRDFITRESYKRLMLHLFTHDAQTSISLQKNPLISYTELAFSLPAPRDLWRAPDAESWRQIYLSKKSTYQDIPCVSEVMHDLNILDELQEHIDIELSYSALLHGFWGQIAAHRETIRFYTSGSGNRGAHQRLWLKSQHQELYHDLCAFSTIIHTAKSRDHSTHLILVLELFLMILHVSPDELQKFAGKYGEEEARLATTSLENWVNTSEARYAVWHAGQVFLNARSLPPASLRGFNAIAVYLACLTLWVYGLLSYPASATAATATTAANHQVAIVQDRDSGVHLHPGPSSLLNGRRLSPDTAARLVPLDGEETRDSKAFLQFNRGLPALTSSGGVVEALSNQGGVALRIARGIFRENFPMRSEPLPPLVESLGNLLRELGSGAGLSSRVVSRVVSRMGSEDR